MIQLVLVRHGQSTWNLENKFTGWVDVDLSITGRKEADSAGKALKEKDFEFDIVYTSMLKRAIHTAYHILEQMDCIYLPVIKCWELNERHYGALQGLNKDEMRQKYGDEQVLLWRRSYDVLPPALDWKDDMNPRNDRKYALLSDDQIPLTESLKKTIERVVPFFEKTIIPLLREKKRVLISAHGNSLRALCKYLENITDEQIINLEIPTGKPLIYELDEQTLHVQKKYYLD
ncbi:MAG: 2,3-diphosphoglycerate-dependent phosphoglycerate mutase [Candidatus Woesearchaeota archaeon]